MCQTVFCFSLIGNLYRWSNSSFLKKHKPLKTLWGGVASFFDPLLLGLFKVCHLRQRSHKIQTHTTHTYTPALWWNATYSRYTGCAAVHNSNPGTYCNAARAVIRTHTYYRSPDVRQHQRQTVVSSCKLPVTINQVRRKKEMYLKQRKYVVVVNIYTCYLLYCKANTLYCFMQYNVLCYTIKLSYYIVLYNVLYCMTCVKTRLY